jgi:hypothetical protein
LSFSPFIHLYTYDMTKVYLFKYDIDNETYYYGQRKDGRFGVMKSTDELSMDVVHMIYSIDLQEGDISIVPLSIIRHYELVGRIIGDLVSNNMYDRCDVYSNNRIFFNDLQSGYTVNVAFVHDDFCITNSKEYKYYIKGLMSILTYSNNESTSIGLQSITGGKVKATYIDTLFNYKHSHLHSGLDISTYCLGVSEIADRRFRNVNINDLDIFYDLMIVDSFVKWESLEGGPYYTVYSLYTRIDINDNTAPVILTEDLIDMLDIKLSYNSSSQMFNSTAKTVASLTPIDVINDSDVSYQFKESNSAGVNRQWIIENYLKDTDFEFDRTVYFKGVRPIEKATFTVEEVNEMINSLFVKKSINISSIVNIINTTINNDVFKPTCSQEATV